MLLIILIVDILTGIKLYFTFGISLNLSFCKINFKYLIHNVLTTFHRLHYDIVDQARVLYNMIFNE